MAEQRDILFCGSVGLENNEAVFTALAEHVGERAKRYPDGETGERTRWFLWQAKLLVDSPDWELGETQNMRFGGWDLIDRPYYKLRDGVDSATFQFGSIGYARVAIESFDVFRRLRDEGRIPAGTRFQVALPTPAAVLIGLVIESQRAQIEPAYEAAMQREVEEMCGAIPHRDLAIQWDVCSEILGFDGGPEPIYYDDILRGTVDRVGRFASWIPEEVELGIHLCYGDPGHKHIIEPADTGTSVLFANGICERVERKIDWLHLPVPRERDDDAYFSPLDGLVLQPDTRLYLGLIHLTLGAAGTAQLIAAAKRHAPDFGLATECGFGRRDPATIPDLLKLHSEVAG